MGFESLNGLIGLFLLMVLQVIVPPISAELIVISSGKNYGVTLSTLVAGSGIYLGSFLVYLAGNYIHQKFARFFNRKKILRILQGFNSHHQWILWVRILPYNPSDIISYAAGIAKINRTTFLTIGLFTSYIRCFLLAWMGKQIEDWKSAFLALSFLVVSAVVAHAPLYRKK